MNEPATPGASAIFDATAEGYATGLAARDWEAAVPGWPFAMTVAATFTHRIVEIA